MYMARYRLATLHGQVVTMTLQHVVNMIKVLFSLLQFPELLPARKV